MTYQVLARKYRPQRFEDVLGQDHITRTLKNAINAGRLHHAYLFTGVRGVGKTTVARILAKTLNCETAPVEEPCNSCKNCLDITGGSDMDVQEIDGASNTGVDDVREIRERIKYLPAQGRYKIYIIDEVHMLSTAAFNALLKTLEEPPSHVIFVFATTEPHKIPATILSRCQRYDFRRISATVIADAVKKIALSEGVNVEPDALIAIAAEAEGSMRDAQSLFDQAVAFSEKGVTYESLKNMLGFMDRAQLRTLLSAIVDKDPHAAISVVSDIFDQGGNLIRLAQEMIHWLRGMLVVRATGDQAFLKDLPSEDRQFISDLASRLGVDEWEQMFHICYRQAEELSRSRYPKMLMESMVIQLSTLGPVSSVDELLDKVDKMMKGLPREDAADRTPAIKTDQTKVSRVPEDSIPNPASRKTIDDSAWGEFLGWLHNEKPQLSSILEHGSFVGGGAGIINLKYSKDSIYGEMLKEDHRKSQLESFIEKYFGGKYAINFNMISEEVPTQVRKKKMIEEKKEKDKRLKEETLSHEIIKEATSLLGADIKSIKIKD